MKETITYSDFLPIWKEFIKGAESVLNVQMVAHHFYNLALETMVEQARPTITKIDDRVVAVTLTDSEHRVTKVLWQAQKPLSDEAISDVVDEVDKQYATHPEWIFFFAKAIEKAHGIR